MMIKMIMLVMTDNNDGQWPLMYMLALFKENHKIESKNILKNVLLTKQIIRLCELIHWLTI